MNYNISSERLKEKKKNIINNKKNLNNSGKKSSLKFNYNNINKDNYGKENGNIQYKLKDNISQKNIREKEMKKKV